MKQIIVAFFILIGLVLLYIGIGMLSNLTGGELGEDQVYCTMDAKICPDGSGVGRVGPRCEFAPCPNEIVEE